MIRLLASFLFALVILAFGHFGTWWFAAKHAEDKIMATVNAMPNITFVLSEVIPRGYPESVSLEVHDMKLIWEKDSKKIILHTNKALINTPMFDMRKTSVTLDKEIFFDVEENNKTIRSFRIVTEGGHLSSFWRPDGATEHAINVDNLTIWDTKSEKPDTAELRMGPGYLVRETPGVRTPVSWRMSVRDIKAVDSFIGESFTINRLVSSIGFEKDFFSAYGSDFLPLLSPTKEQRNSARQALAEKMVSSTSLPQLFIESMQIEKEQNWVSLRGGFGINEQHYLDGQISLNTNDLNPVLKFMTNMNIVDKSNLNKNRLVSNILAASENPSNISILLERDRAYINSSKVAEMPSFTELMRHKE